MSVLKGFTLIELLVSIAVLSITLCLAAVSFNHFYDEESASAVTQRLFDSLHFARMESIKRNKVVSVCGTSDFKQCDFNWSHGLMVYVDVNADGYFSDNDILLRQHHHKNKRIKISAGKRTSFKFTPNGRSTTRGTLNVARDEQLCYAVVVYDSGRARVQHAAKAY